MECRRHDTYFQNDFHYISYTKILRHKYKRRPWQRNVFCICISAAGVLLMYCFICVGELSAVKHAPSTTTSTYRKLYECIDEPYIFVYVSLIRDMLPSRDDIRNNYSSQTGFVLIRFLGNVQLLQRNIKIEFFLLLRVNCIYSNKKIRNL